jgi:hypothetical protein
MVCAILVTDGAQAQEGLLVVIPADANQPAPAGPGPGAMIVFTGRALTTVETTGCRDGTFPMQQGIVIDPGADRASRVVSVILLSQTEPVAPGTRLGGLTYEGDCELAGTTYSIYNGVLR